MCRFQCVSLIFVRAKLQITYDTVFDKKVSALIFCAICDVKYNSDLILDSLKHTQKVFFLYILTEIIW